MSKINETNYPRRTQASYTDTDMLVIQAAGGNTYTTRLEDMREDYKETLAPILSALQDDVNENLATIEGSTASKAYAKGDFLVFGGRLCKAKTSIASGATLVLDTNIELDSVGDELSSISSDLANVDTSISFFHQQTVMLDHGGYSGAERVKYYAQQTTFAHGTNIVEVQDLQNLVRGTFFVSAQANAYYTGIYVGYYTDYVYRVSNNGGTLTVKQLAEV